MAKDEWRLSPEVCRWNCDLSGFEFESTDDLKEVPAILGQDRAVKAIQLGLAMSYPGYNIFISGEAGTGRNTTVRHLLRDVNHYRPTPNDIAFVHNFLKPDTPLVLILPPGKGGLLRRMMENLAETLRLGLPQVFESDRYRENRQQITDEYGKAGQVLIDTLENKVQKANFTVVQVQLGPMVKQDVLPVIDGQPVSFEQLEEQVKEGTLDVKELKKLAAQHRKFAAELQKTIESSKKLSREAQEKLESLDRNLAESFVDEAMQEIRQNISVEAAHAFLDAVRENVLGNLAWFRKKTDSETESLAESAARDPLLMYGVNVVVDNSHNQGAPIIFENLPTLNKLFGTIERVMDANGQWYSDFSTIRPGSLLAANGGYLIIDAKDLLSEPGVWNNLKRVFKTRKLEIWAPEISWAGGPIAIKPEPIDIDVKLILIGEPLLYYLLYTADSDFSKIFKIKAEFDYEIKNSRQSVLKYAVFIQRLCAEENLLPFGRSGLARVVEAGVRLSGHQTKVSTRFNQIAELVREAAFYARQDLAKYTIDAHVDRALEERRSRRNLAEEKVQEMIADDLLLIDTDGRKIGQVNGLSVLNLGDYAFGKPARITAQTGVGRTGIVNVEREVALSGPSHDKGVLVISGYLQQAFAQDKPLALSASLCFEQSYSEVDGDSASSAELYALLSRLARIPIDQGLAVTGSVNQNGEIQPIGGVNEKIEGFFAVCQARGLTGRQGVVIPRRNVTDLMLHPQVVEAIAADRFHLFAVDSIAEGIELLTGMPAGEADQSGRYPEESVFGHADRTCREYLGHLRAFNAPFTL
ncbi:AAA family ATPase [candidate division KSB1 bacterium]|nr:AAA family ATPase [candidate division KSB1 bacterium]